MKLLSLAVWLSSSLTFAASITVHNTGVNSSDVLVASGSQVSFWTLSGKPVGAPEPIGGNPFRLNCCYWADTATAAWVAPTSNGNAGPGGIYTYDLVIDLTGLNPATASISGKFGSDNSGSVFLNANAPVLTQLSNFSSYPAAANFTINSGFVAGLNTIHITVNNEGDPTAFFVEFTSATANPLVGGVPEPATVMLTCAGLLGVLAFRARRA
jgi:hypothetical protein